MERKMWAHWVHPSFKKGQAILELAVFGSILIMLLGVLVSYGMKYNFQQQLMQQAFRKALGITATERSATYILIKDRHIPNPANAFAVGSVTPVSASVSVVRNYRMQETADTADELPQTYFNINDQIQKRKTAAFRNVSGIPVSQLEDDYDSDGSGKIDTDEEDRSRYDYIYGSTSWEDLGDGCLTEEICTTECETDENDTETCKETCVCPAGYKSKDIRIIDDCAGEIMDYDSMQKRCYRIKIAGIKKPWYCDEAYKPKATLFAFANNYGYSSISDLSELYDEHKPSMGLQSDYSQQMSRYGDPDSPSNNILEKVETNSGITTTDTLNWRVDTKRTIVYNDGLSAKGFSRSDIVNIQEPEITSSVSQNKTYEWQTPF